MALRLSKKKGQARKVVKKIQPIKKAKATATALPDLDLPTGKYIEAIGRRKVATARVRIYEESTGFYVNGKLAEAYFANINNAVKLFHEAFEITGTKGKFAVSARVSGSGVAAQLDAVVLGLSRALAKFNPENRTILKAEDMLRRDDRMKETRKIGMGGKARRKRQSPRR